MKKLLIVSYLSLAGFGCSCESSNDNQSARDCRHNNGGCDPNARCIEQNNVPACVCLPWYYGNGLFCEKSGLQEGSPWPMEGGNAWHTGQSPYVGSQTGLLQREFALSEAIDSTSSPVIAADGTVYIGVFRAYHAISKNETTSPKPIFTGCAFTTCRNERVFSTAAIGSDGIVYVGGNQGGVYAIDPNVPEQPKWSLRIDQEISGSSPAIDKNGMLYINFNIYTSSRERLYTFNAFNTASAVSSSAKPKWSSSKTNEARYAPVIGADGTIYVGSEDGNLYAFTPEGDSKWVYSAGYSIDSSPVIGADETIYIEVVHENEPPELKAIDPYASDESKRLKWSWRFPSDNTGARALALSADGTIYVAGHGWNDQNQDYEHCRLYAIDSKNVENGMKPKWQFDVGDPIRAAPAIGADGTIYVGSDDRNVYAINPDGTEKWRFQTEGMFRSSPAIAADGTVYIGNYDGNLYAFGD